MPFSRSINTFPTAVLLAVTLATTIGIGSAYAQIKSFSVGPDQSTTPYPNSNLPVWPDEHVTFIPDPQINGFLVFGSSSLTAGGVSGAAVLETQDLQTFSFATGLGYSQQVMNAPVTFTSCRSDPADNTEFDENYVGPGTVVQDPTLPPGNLIMIYEAENHCPGGTNQFDYYASAGLARSSDNGKTWPAPIDQPLGGTNRYAALQSATPEPTSVNNVNLGNAIPSAYVDGDYLYIVYEYVTSPSTPADNLMRIARANLVSDNVTGTLQFHKWYNGAFSQPGLGGSDSSPLPSAGCTGGVQRQGSLAHDDDLGLYIMIFLCIDNAQGQAGWYYSSTTSLDTEVWTAPQLITGSLMPWVAGCPPKGGTNGTQFDGFYPSIMSNDSTLAAGHIHNTGRIYFLSGCDGGSYRFFDYREFTVTPGLPPAHDFNADGKSDILWRDVGGDAAIWEMSGGSVLGSASLGNVPTNWSVVGTRDFNGDGIPDLLWRDTAGDVWIWLMGVSGSSVTVSQSSVIGNEPTTWSVVGTGDFDADGKGDILWRDTSGNLKIWFMNSFAVSEVPITNVPTIWSVAGVGDFNADGKSDILWHDIYGDVSIWEMSGGTILAGSGLGNIPTNWSIVGTGDFNGDGTSDIVWRDTAGDVLIQLISNATLLQQSVLGNVATTWSITETGDFNGDGKCDILWLDTSGNVMIWFMNGFAVSAVNFGNVGTAWSVSGANAD